MELVGSVHSDSLELQGEAVHAVTQASRLRAIVEDMPKMTATIRAMHLGPGQVRGAIRALADRIWQRLEEARPAGPTLELRFRAKQLLTAAGADEHATAMLVVERTCERSFSPLTKK